LAGDLGTIRIGEEFEVGGQHSCYIAGISGKTVAGGAAVFVNSDGKLGTNTSSERFKDHIQSMGEASEAILALRPVSFRYKKEIDPHRIPQFGLIAEEVERVNPDLIIRDKEGKPLTVRYEQINAMLLNEFLKEHKKVEEQQATIAELKSAVAKHEAAGSKQEAAIALQQKQIQTLTASLNKQAAQIQKVSARVELNRPAPQELVLNLP
jgi:hypothetical protein